MGGHWSLYIRYLSLLQNSQPLDLEEALIRLYERLPQVETYVNVKTQ